MSNPLHNPWLAAVSRTIAAEAEQLWATGMFEDYGDKERDKFAIRAQGFPRPDSPCLWLEAVGDLDGPALSVVLVRCVAEQEITGGLVTCLVAGREYTLVPDYAFWDWEQQPDGRWVTLTFGNFDYPETLEAFAAMIRQDEPVLIRIKGANTTVEFTVTAVDLQWLRDVLTLYRARGGAWLAED